MTRRLRVVDQTLLLHPPGPVYELLLDVASYGAWWPAPLRFRVLSSAHPAVGTAVRISNGPLVHWTATIARLEAPREIELVYGDGAWDGPTCWRLEPEAGGTRLSCEIDLAIVPLWLRLLSRVISFEQLHSKQMQTVFAALARRLGFMHPDRDPRLP